MEGGGWRVEGGGWRVEGGGWRVEWKWLRGVSNPYFAPISRLAFFVVNHTLTKLEKDINNYLSVIL